jgi:hypothetical protein
MRQASILNYAFIPAIVGALLLVIGHLFFSGNENLLNAIGFIQLPFLWMDLCPRCHCTFKDESVGSSSICHPPGCPDYPGMVDCVPGGTKMFMALSRKWSN